MSLKYQMWSQKRASGNRVAKSAVMKELLGNKKIAGVLDTTRKKDAFWGAVRKKVSGGIYRDEMKQVLGSCYKGKVKNISRKQADILSREIFKGNKFRDRYDFHDDVPDGGSANNYSASRRMSDNSPQGLVNNNKSDDVSKNSSVSPLNSKLVSISKKTSSPPSSKVSDTVPGPENSVSIDQVPDVHGVPIPADDYDSKKAPASIFLARKRMLDRSVSGQNSTDKRELPPSFMDAIGVKGISKITSKMDVAFAKSEFDGVKNGQEEERSRRKKEEKAYDLAA